MSGIKMAECVVAHSIADGSGYIPFVKFVLYQYLVRTHSEPIRSQGINLTDTPFLPGEFDFPSMERLPQSDFSFYQAPPMGYFPADDYMRAIKEANSQGNGYYSISIKQREFMKYIHSNDASPAAIISVFMSKALAPLFPREEEVFSAEIACNFKDVVGTPHAVHSLSRALHIR